MCSSFSVPSLTSTNGWPAIRSSTSLGAGGPGRNILLQIALRCALMVSASRQNPNAEERWIRWFAINENCGICLKRSQLMINEPFWAGLFILLVLQWWKARQMLLLVLKRVLQILRGVFWRWAVHGEPDLREGQARKMLKKQRKILLLFLGSKTQAEPSGFFSTEATSLY